MQFLGLVGRSLAHSFSPSYFEKKFAQLQIKCKYKRFELENINEITKMLTNFENLVGFNVTIPYKRQIIPFLDQIDAVAAHIQAVNTVLKHPDSAIGWIGFNTDCYGFETALLEFVKNRTIPPTLILGAGGAAQAVLYVLSQYLAPAQILICSRTPPPPSINIFRRVPNLSFDKLTPNILRDYPLIINATPLGMLPYIDHYPPIPINALSPQNYVFDLIYNPEKTLLLRMAQERGAHIKNGWSMLQYQAEKAWEIWDKHWTLSSK
jgi:shikimate dehydrogenase